MSKVLPRYPIYIPSKGRYDNCLSAIALKEDGVPFRLVVEKEEAEFYSERFGEENVYILPFSNQGSVIPARNWCKEHSKAEGHKRHWQLDDNVMDFYRFYKGKRIRCEAGVAFRAVEDFTDRYTNIAVSGMNYTMFAISKGLTPFFLNCHVYSISLILNETEHKWRGRYNEDTDMCLQVLADGWCTVAFNAFLANKQRTMVMKGGNTTEIYDGDGRLKMARSLERMWPNVTSVGRRFQRPQHVVRNQWRNFDTPLKRRTDIDWDNLPRIDNYGLELKQKGEEVRSSHLKNLMSQHNTSETGNKQENG